MALTWEKPGMVMGREPDVEVEEVEDVRLVFLTAGGARCCWVVGGGEQRDVESRAVESSSSVKLLRLGDGRL